MPSNPQASSRMDLGEQLLLETSVLRTLCLTANSESSELRQRILEKLVEADFYFPITRAVFSTVCDLNHGGANVEAGSLEQALAERSVDVPDDFFLEDLFAGETPSSATLEAWLAGLKRGPKTDLPDEEEESSITHLEKTRPSVKSNQALREETPPAKEDDPPSEGVEAAVTPPAKNAAEEPEKVDTKESVVANRPEPEKAPLPANPTEPDDADDVPVPRAEVASAPDSPVEETSHESATIERAPPIPVTRNESVGQDILSPESGEWLGFLAEVTKKQGERLKTGFHGFDSKCGGLGPGLLLLAGETQQCRVDFLKQLVDQIAIHCRVPCLYLTFERSKAELRLQTLSRLSGAPADDIQKGRFEKDSAVWVDVVRAGEQAVEWLQRIYIVEAQPGLAVTRMRELRQGLIGSGAGPICLIAVDNLEKMASGSDLLQSVAELKELAEALGIAVVGAAAKLDLVHQRSADMVVTFREHDGESTLEVRAPGASEPTLLRFIYSPEVHRFTESSTD